MSSDNEMPSEGMNKDEPGLPMIKPAGSSPQQPSWEPGVVEVEFQEGIRPSIIAGPGGQRNEIKSLLDTNLTRLNEILRQYNIQRAESSIMVSSEEEADQAQANARQQGIEVPNLRNFITLHFEPNADTKRIAEELSTLPEVVRAVPVPKAIPPSTPINEPLVGTSDQVVVDPTTGLEKQWYIYRCRANRAWTMSSGKNVIIADIDWGYRTTHQDLRFRIDFDGAYNSFDGGTNVSHGDSIGHGTAVIGLAGGADNNLGMVGFAFESILWPIQANSGSGSPLGGNPWAGAIEKVRATNSRGRRKVIILEVQTGSYGNYEMIPSVNAAIRTAIGNGVVVCVAAGNGDRDAGTDDSGNPIPATGSILVGATAYHPTENQRAWFSNYGRRIMVSAPGDGGHDVTCKDSSDSAYRNNFGGTSGATPKVAGTAALMLAVNPRLTHEQIREILRRTGGPVTLDDPSKPIGTFLNTEAAVRAAI